MTLFLSFLFSAFSLAQANTSCSVEGTATCASCKAPTKLACDNGQSGHIEKTDKVSSLTVKVVQADGSSKLIKLEKPPGVIDDYKSALNSSWIRTQLNQKGIGFADVYLDSVSTEDPPVLYSDMYANLRVAPTEKSVLQGGFSCTQKGPPVLIKAQFCSGLMCYMMADCSMLVAGVKKPIGENALFCRPVNGNQCPTATACANDQEITSELILNKPSEKPAAGTPTGPPPTSGDGKSGVR